MRGSIIQETLAGFDCSLYLPPNYKESKQLYPVIYLLGCKDLSHIMTILEKSMSAEPKGGQCKEAIIVGIETQIPERDYTPWEADALSARSRPFSGKADHFLYILETQIKTFIDKNYRTKSDIEYTSIAGYSLAGLTAIYALYTTDFALTYASVSGSLWFPKWDDFIKKHKLRQMSEDGVIKVYVSLGKTEANASDKLKGKVAERTEETVKVLKEQVAALGQDESDIFFEYNEGGHWEDIPERTAKALAHLLAVEE
ncbi:MAG: hypothetical protein K6G80_04200 [Treponema sp.]|nr:hypothetical protein [Treponema sp.]